MFTKKPSSLMKYSVSDRDFLNKKPKRSVKYLNISSKTNSGLNAYKKQQIENEIFKYYKVRNDEPFRRISLGNLLHLMATYVEESSFVASSEGGKPEAHFVNEIEEDVKNELKDKENMEHFEFPSGYASEEKNDEDAELRPFLLVDVRLEADFTKGHIATAISYPYARLSHAVSWETRDLRQYRNHPEWIIVLYDENETLSPDVASTLIHRGYENVFVLSGGFRLASDKVGPPFITTDPTRTIQPGLADFLTEKSFSGVLRTGSESAVNWWEAKGGDRSRVNTEISSGCEAHKLGRTFDKDSKKQ